jgi:hypothetical protein
MRFMLFMHPAIEPEESDWTPSPEAVATMERYNDELRRAGVLLDLAGLHSPSNGVAVRWKAGRPVVEDGPFGEAKEVVGGYWMIQAASKEEAVQWASRVPNGGESWIEVRQVQEPEDFPPEVRAVLSRDTGAA